MSFEAVTVLEKQIAEFFGAPFAVCLDACTHGLELCIRHEGLTYINVPKRTYISVPFLAHKLNIGLTWREENWVDYYRIDDKQSRPIYDAAVLWKKGSYIPGSFMCLSFQFQKHLSLGRGGAILCDNLEDATRLKKMSYDGRMPGIPWRDQNIDSFGYHYYMTPETGKLGLEKIDDAIKTTPRKWKVEDWPDLTLMDVFK